MTFTQTETKHIPKAAKSHSCSWCAELIPAKTSYFRWRCFDSQDAGTVKMHPECYAALQKTPRYEVQDGWAPGQFERGQSGD